MAYYAPDAHDYIPGHSAKTVRQIVDDGKIGEHDRIAYLTGTKRAARALEIPHPHVLFQQTGQKGYGSLNRNTYI